MPMKAHTLALEESKNLCNELFAALQQAIPNLKRSATQASCGLYQEGNARFAYVYHRVTQLQIEIWCRGDVDELQRYDQGLVVKMRNTQNPGWEREFPARFQFRNLNQITTALTLLVQVSFPASKA